MILAAVAMRASIAPVTAHRVEVQAIKTLIVMVLLVVRPNAHQGHSLVLCP